MTDIARKERDLTRQLAEVRSQIASQDRAVRINRDLSLGGLPPDTSHKAKFGSADTPDVIQLPTKKRRRTENKW